MQVIVPKVTIKFAAKVSLDVVNELAKVNNADRGDMQTAVQAIDIIVSQIPSMRCGGWVSMCVSVYLCMS